MSSTCTGRKVPAPTCSVTHAVSTPAACSASRSGASKCSPAVGAATAPGCAGIHGLVAGFVGTGRRARDVRRQRDRGVSGEVVGKRCHAGEAQPEESVVAPDDGRLDGARKDDRLPRTGGVAGTDLEEALVEAQHPLQQELNPAAGGLGADEPRLHDPGVVQHQEVAGAEQARQVAEAAIGEHLAGEVQEPAVGALGRRRLGDPVRRQFEVEVGQRVVAGCHGRARGVVPGEGIEPSWPCGRQILSLLRIPVPPSRPRNARARTGTRAGEGSLSRKRGVRHNETFHRAPRVSARGDR